MNAGHKERLVRRHTEEEQSSLECSLGFTPRKGKQARRERDCIVDCDDFEACDKQRRKAYWKETK